MKAKYPFSIAVRLVLAFAGGLAVAGTAHLAADEPAPAATTTMPSETSRAVAAANVFLATLDDAGRAESTVPLRRR